MEDINSEKPRRGIFFRLFKWLVYTLVVVVLLLVALLALLLAYEDEVKAAIIGELNKNLKAEVKIDPQDIDLTLLKTFPDCSLEFKNVLMLEALKVKHRDTLLFAGRLGLSFNVMDLWHKHYEIKALYLHDAIARPVILSNGKNNFTFWDSASSNSGSAQDSIAFNLDKVEIENLKLKYTNRQQKVKTELEIKTLALKGRFSEKSYAMETEASLLIKQVVQEKTVFLKNKNLDFALELDVENNTYTFRKTSVSLNRLGLELSGNFTYSDSLEKINMSYKAPGLDISSVLSLLPETYRNKINDYKSDGNFYASGTINYSPGEGLLCESRFGIKNGEITYRPLSTRASKVNLEGYLKYSPSVTLLELKRMSLWLNNDQLSAECRISDFSDPQVQVSLESAINLENLQNFWPVDTLTHLRGELSIKAKARGKLSDLKSRAFSDKVSLELRASLSNLETRFKHDEKMYSIKNCSVIAIEREIEVRNLQLKRDSSDLTINGKMPGIFNYLADRESPLVITGSLESDYIRLSDFLPTKSSGTISDSPLIPRGIECKLNARIGKFTYATFTAHNISGQIDIKNQKALVSGMALESMEGSAQIDAYADNSKDRLDVVLRGRMQNINIRKLFNDFNNFGQTTLTGKNLEGYLTSELEMNGTWSNRLEADLNSIYVNADITVEKGGLNDYKSLQDLSEFLKASNLSQIRFSTLQSKIYIEKQVISLPRIFIKNSALDIQLTGTHSFENIMDYNLRIRSVDLNDKRKNEKGEFEALERDEENRRTVFIKMKGHVDHPKISYDFKDMKAKIKEDIKNEKEARKEITRLFLEDIGIRKKDTVTKKIKEAEQVFELEKPSAKKPKKQSDEKPPDDEGDF